MRAFFLPDINIYLYAPTKKTASKGGSFVLFGFAVLAAMQAQAVRSFYLKGNVCLASYKCVIFRAYTQGRQSEFMLRFFYRNKSCFCFFFCATTSL
ncbi:Uncharacterised protein [Citrobacter freundii]|nr:Uncharacterised protein [Citrobacter freundii]